MQEEELIKSAQNGQSDAVDKLLSKYKFLVKIVARKYFLMGGEREDLTQEGMIGLYKAIVNFSKERGAFKSFARLCIEKQIQDAVKKANRQKHKALNSFFSIDLASEKGLLPTENLEQMLIEKEQLSERFRKIETLLSSKEKKVLDFYLQGLSYSEIAEKLKTTTKSIDNAISRIKIKLKPKN